MPSLHSRLSDHKTQIKEHLRLSSSSRGHPLGKIRRIEQQSTVCKDEEVWTYLLACGYAIDGADSVERLAELLTGNPDLPKMQQPAIWLEFGPMTPRMDEYRSHIDLAVGNITSDGTKSGIKLAGKAEADSWVCLCEMKWEADISPGVTHDERRNQLIRIIDSALYFHNETGYVRQAYVALVTPAVFKYKSHHARLYQYKLEEYCDDLDNIVKDLHNCRLRRRDGFDAATRIDALQLRWKTFEDLFAAVPPSPISEGIAEFRRIYGSYLNAR